MPTLKDILQKKIETYSCEPATRLAVQQIMHACDDCIIIENSEEGEAFEIAKEICDSIITYSARQIEHEFTHHYATLFAKFKAEFFEELDQNIYLVKD